MRAGFAAALALLAGLATPASAQDGTAFAFSDAARANYPGEVRLGTGPGQPREDWFRQNGSLQVRNVSEATLTPFLPPASANTGAAVIVAPGGAFLGLAIEEEGFRIAKWLADHGVAAFVLKYRLLATPADPATFRREVIAVRTGTGPASFRPPEDTPAHSLADGVAAMRHVRANAQKYGIDPQRVGMMGFSAGAFLTLSTTLKGDANARPAFIAPIYGRQVAVEVPADAPPMYLVLAADDPLFGGGGLDLVQSWRNAGRPVEFHLYQKGGHGFGPGAAGTTTEDWMDGLLRWLRMNAMLGGK